MTRQQRRRATGSRIAGAVGIVLAVVVLGGLVYLQAWPPIKVVMSSSMEPSINTGDVVLMRHLSRPPAVGEVVAVPVPAEVRERFGYPKEVLHRVIEVTDDGLVRTQGDNLDEPDPFGVPISSVGEGVFTVVPGAGRAIAFLASPYGLVWVAAGVILFIIMPFFGSHRELVTAVEEYGYHLRSHTQIVQSMSTASQELSATVVQLRETLEERSPPPPDPLPSGEVAQEAPQDPPAASEVRHEVSDPEHEASNVEDQVTNVKHEATDIEHEATVTDTLAGDVADLLGLSLPLERETSAGSHSEPHEQGTTLDPFAGDISTRLGL
ncbi:MAG: signal peptidase I [Acidimicrobiia bacterium]